MCEKSSTFAADLVVAKFATLQNETQAVAKSATPYEYQVVAKFAHNKNYTPQDNEKRNSFISA